MKLTKSQKVYVAVLAAAVAAFLVDRVFLGGPVDEASAAEPGSAAVEAPALNAAPAEAPSGPSIAARLAELQHTHAVDPRHMREAFLPSAAWSRRLRPPASPSNSQRPTTPTNTTSRIDQFVASHRLKSILHLDDGGVALVDDKVVPIGGTLDGFKLLELTEDAAIFDLQGQRAELRLAATAGQ